MAEEINRHFPKDMQVVNRQVNNFLSTHQGNAIRYHFIPLRMVHIKKNRDEHWSKGAENKKPLTQLTGKQSGLNPIERNVDIPQYTKNLSTI